MPQSRIDAGLFNRPKVRARLEALASDPGVSIKIMRAAAAKAGIKTSLTAVSRWMLGYRRGQANGTSTLLSAVIRKVIELDEAELKRLAGRLRVRRPL